MATTLSSSERAQLAQTVEMFEGITQAEPHDYQSLEILKEAYSKLNQEKDVINTSKRIAQAYVQLGQFASAKLEYEAILQRCPDDAEAKTALQEIASQADNLPAEPAAPLEIAPAALRVSAAPAPAAPATGQAAPGDVEDGRQTMYKLFVESRIIAPADFGLCWPVVDPRVAPEGVIEPFIQALADRNILPADQSLKILSDQSRCAFIPLNTYDIDMDLARRFPAATCRRWCVLPFDRMSKSVLVATANPFNHQAGKELSKAAGSRLLWYLVPPHELIINLRKAFR